jgi:uncharacterized protein YkwD
LRIKTLYIRALGALLIILFVAFCNFPLFAQQNDLPQDDAVQNSEQLYLPTLASGHEVFALSPGGTIPPVTIPPVDAPAPAVTQLLMLLNQEHERAGCAPFTTSSLLTSVAQAHSEDMAPSATHESPDGSLAGERLDHAGYGTGYWGENLAISVAPSSQEPTEEMAAEVMAGWLADQTRPFYAENLRICEFTQIGIGIHTPAATTPGSHYWVVVFAGPLEPDTAAFTVDTTNRAEVATAYRDLYLPTLETPTGWDGNQVGCSAGTTSVEYQEAVRFQINYFRAMAGVPANVVLSDKYNHLAQAAALIMSANRFMSHDPSPASLCYSESGEQGSGSNLYNWTTLSSLSPIAEYIEERGDNEAVNHRRWLLMPEQYVMGVGTVDLRDDLVPNLPYANATYVQSDWVISGLLGGGYRGVLHSSNPDSFVTWPPSGYVPHDLIYPRWSIQHHDADFQDAQVQVTLDGAPVPVKIEYITETEFVGISLPSSGFVWIPQVDWATLDMSQDHQVQVEIRNIKIDGKSKNLAYQLTIFDPAVE